MEQVIIRDFLLDILLSRIISRYNNSDSSALSTPWFHFFYFFCAPVSPAPGRHPRRRERPPAAAAGKKDLRLAAAAG
jgi:hypothetical protein